jgi:hypothetical protein
MSEYDKYRPSKYKTKKKTIAKPAANPAPEPIQSSSEMAAELKTKILQDLEWKVFGNSNNIKPSMEYKPSSSSFTANYIWQSAYSANTDNTAPFDSISHPSDDPDLSDF